MPPALLRHPDSFLTLPDTSADRRGDMPYRKTYDFPGETIGPQHQALTARLHPTGMIDIGIEGWLLPPDALKLYEMAYFADGDILELGAYRGLSAFVMNGACNDSGVERVIVSIDLDPFAVEASRERLHAAPGGTRAWFFNDEGAATVRNLAGIKRQFGFAFIDHSHRYEHVFDVCQILHRVMALGGFALFHDFNDPRNSRPQDLDYGVYQGAMDGLRQDRLEFWGIFGCTGLFRRIGPC
jgi:cephalosporin hydroxylase